MDLLRRAASGELSALLGPTLLSADSVLRPHLFRERAQAAYAALPDDHRAILDAYASGVNAGTDALGARPFEYLVLRQAPEAWRPEDALLAAYAMTIDLQRADLDDELAVFARTEALPPALARFLDPGGDRWDAPLAGEAISAPPPPEADSLGGFLPTPVGESEITDGFLSALQRDALRVGSNNWAVSGARTESGAAMVANDMHLGISLPNIWFRASMTVTPEAGVARTVTGVTLPGTPLVIVGSNGSVAWGFTNSYGDYVDLVRLEMEPGMTNLVRTDTGTVELSTQRETLFVAGADSVLLDVEISPWGPVLLEDGRGDRYAVQWAAHRPEATNLRLIELEEATTLDEALDIANRSGIPAQNFVAGDSEWPHRLDHRGTNPRARGPQRPAAHRLHRSRRAVDRASGARGRTAHRGPGAMDSSGPPTPASSAATRSGSSAMAGTPLARARSRSATAFARSRVPSCPQTSSRSSSTTAPCS